MDWLSKHKAQLDCAARQIQLTHSSEDVIVFAARDNTIRLFSLNEKGELDALFVNGLEMKQCDAPVSKRTFAGISLTGRLPMITSDGCYFADSGCL